jgi:hypothetical protein
MVLIQVRLPPEATFDDALQLLGISPEEADTGYGLLTIAPGLHVLRICEEAGGRVDRDLCRVFSDPRIEPTF